MRNPAEIFVQRPSLRVEPYVRKRTFADPTAHIAVRRVERTTRLSQAVAIVEFPQLPTGCKTLFRERAWAASNKPFADLLTQFRDGAISLREFGVQRAALIRASHKQTRGGVKNNKL